MHVTQLVSVNSERKHIPVRVADSMGECLTLVKERMPDTIIVADETVVSVVSAAITDRQPNFIVLDYMGLL